jgi:probable phosphoglycerate mutase
MMRLYFARHGESEANLLRIISNRDLPHGLTALGRQQAAGLAAQLAGAGLTAMYASPLLRARQTAEILSEHLGLPFKISAALREYDCGVLEGKSDPESWRLHQKLREDWLIRHQWDSAITDGERFDDIRRRFLPFVQGLVEAAGPAERSILLIGHGGLYQCMLPLLLTDIHFAWAAHQPFPNTAYVLAESRPGGLVCLDWCGNQLEVPEEGENTV